MITQAENVCHIRNVTGSVYVQFTNYLAHSEQCLYEEWQIFMEDAIEKGNNLGTMSQFVSTVGNSYSHQLANTYSNLTQPTLQYYIYYNGLSMVTSSMKNTFNVISKIMDDANKNFLQVIERMLLIINSIFGTISSAKLNGLLKTPACDLTVMQDLFLGVLINLSM